MKKVFLAIAIIGIALGSCSKDEDKELSVEQTSTYGIWEVIGGDDFIACPDGDNQLIEISETDFTEGMTDDAGCNIENNYISYEYTYVNGNTFDVGLGTYKITEFADNTMTIVLTSMLAEGSITYKLEKK